MKTARNQFGDSVGAALDAAACEGVPPVELISYFGSYIDIVVRINGEDRHYEGDWLKSLKFAMDQEEIAMSGTNAHVPT